MNREEIIYHFLLSPFFSGVVQAVGLIKLFVRTVMVVTVMYQLSVVIIELAHSGTVGSSEALVGRGR